MDKGVELIVTADEVSRSWSSPAKSYGVCYGVTSLTVTCLLVKRQASFRRQELYSGFITELGNLQSNAKGNAQWGQPKGRKPKCFAETD
jgi:hypothetical protein